MGTAASFLEALYGDLDKGVVVLWRSDTRKSKCLTPGDWGPADEFAALPADCYFGVGVQAERMPTGQRGKAETVIAIPGLWADIDLDTKPQNGKATKKKYPSEEVARKALAEMPVAPSVLVASGNGLHAYWLFNELWTLPGADERTEAHSVEAGWLRLLKRHLGDYDLDMVHDLARVMRLPGSTHQGAGREVTIEGGLSDAWLRYSRDDFTPFSFAMEAMIIPVAAPSANGTGMPGNKFDAIMANSPDFKRTWERKRKEFTSQSEYDQSIASQLAIVGWSDTEIAAAVRRHRERHNETPTKADRADYMARTLTKARSGPASAVTGLTDLLDVADAEADESPPDERTLILAKLSDALGVPVDGWIQSGRERAIVTLRLVGGQEVVIGSLGAAIEGPRLMRERLAAECQRYLKVPAKAWPTVVEALLKIVEIGETSDEERAKTVIVGMIRDYIRKSVQADSEDQRQVAVVSGKPFLIGNVVHISLSKFLGHVARYGSEKLDRSAAINTLRQFGWESTKISYRVGESTSSKTYWRGRLE